MADTWPDSRQTVVIDHRAVQHENALLRELVTVYQHLTGLTLQDADVSTVARLLAERTTSTVAVVSRGLDVLAAASADAGEDVADDVRAYLASPRLAAVLSNAAQTRRSLRLPDVGDAAKAMAGGMRGAGPPAGGVIVAPILVGDDVPAYLMTFGSDRQDDDMSLLVTEHAATICGVILGRERIVAAAARQVRDDLFEGLLIGGGRDNGEVARWARHLGYDATREHRILAVTFEAAGPARPAGAATALRNRVAAAIDHFFTNQARSPPFATTRWSSSFPSRPTSIPAPRPGGWPLAAGPGCGTRSPRRWSRSASAAAAAIRPTSPAPTARRAGRSTRSSAWAARARWSRSRTSACTGCCCRSPTWPS